MTMRPWDCPLTEREWETYQCLADGLRVPTIAKQMGVSTSTVRTYMGSGRIKLGALSWRDGLNIMKKQGWLGWEPPRRDMRTVVAGYLDALDRHAKGDKTARLAMIFYVAEMRRILGQTGKLSNYAAQSALSDLVSGE